jgi:Anti-sigma-K factor rskA
MNSWHRHIDPRAEELLADQAITGLDEQQAQELVDLLATDNAEMQDEFMRTAALVQLGIMSQKTSQLAPMPEHLRNRILAAAPLRLNKAADNATVVNIRPAEQRPAKTSAFWQQPVTGWAVAAMLALSLVILRPDSDASDFSVQRATLISEASDATVTAWTPPDDPRFSGVSGDVVWSDARQAGFMRLSGMPANDPVVQQYQLWIVDPERSAQPVDGGVFDVQAGDSEVIIPINAKLAVNKPAAFAITLEKTGGVVVSAGPLLVVASAGS